MKITSKNLDVIFISYNYLKVVKLKVSSKLKINVLDTLKLGLSKFGKSYLGNESC